MKLLIVGGENAPQAHSQLEWARHKCGVMAVLDTEAGTVRRLLQYFGPGDDAAPVTFKAASVQGGRVIACTTTEVVEFSGLDFQVTRVVSHPWMNDVHHVVEREGGSLLVANTGLDMVMEMSWEGECLNHWFVVPDASWQRFDRELDYRKVASTKPHLSHPNYVTDLGGDILVTRFHQKDAFCLSDGNVRCRIDVGFPHDGVICEGAVWYTTVNGHLCVFNPQTGEALSRWDLNGFFQGDKALGWCRGVCHLGDGLVAVGFSRLRPTRFRENVQWISSKLHLTPTSGVRETRVLVFDTNKGRPVSEHAVESAGVNAIFSIHKMP